MSSTFDQQELFIETQQQQNAAAVSSAGILVQAETATAVEAAAAAEVVPVTINRKTGRPPKGYEQNFDMHGDEYNDSKTEKTADPAPLKRKRKPGRPPKSKKRKVEDEETRIGAGDENLEWIPTLDLTQPFPEVNATHVKRKPGRPSTKSRIPEHGTLASYQNMVSGSGGSTRSTTETKTSKSTAATTTRTSATTALKQPKRRPGRPPKNKSIQQQQQQQTYKQKQNHHHRQQRQQHKSEKQGRTHPNLEQNDASNGNAGQVTTTPRIGAGTRRRGRPPKRYREEEDPIEKEETPEQEEEDIAASADGDGVLIDDDDDDDDDDNDDDDDGDDDDGSSGSDTDPETVLDAESGKVTTIHWDVTENMKIGWRIRILGLERKGKILQYDKGLGFEQDGRILRYDPYSHKHKIQFLKSKRCVWLRLRCTSAQVATRLVWAHVKGYPWWPALIMESDDDDINPKEGYAFVDFIGSSEVATLRDNGDCIRLFTRDKLDPVVKKCKKKRNARSVAMAQEEEETIKHIRNEAVKFYATKAFALANSNYMGKRVRIFRSDVNYPYGDTVVGTVRKYSFVQKKWLLSFEVSDKTNKKYSAAWIDLRSKEYAAKVLDKRQKIQPSDEKLVPFLYGFHYETSATERCHEGTDAYLGKLLSERCRACVDNFRENKNSITCVDCEGCYHLSCVDPPISMDAWQRILKDGTSWKCPKCTLCRGCYQKDIVYGSHPNPVPSSVSFPAGESLNLCTMCVKAYENKKYCPNCAHIWDDIKYYKVLGQLESDDKKGILALPSRYRVVGRLDIMNVDPAVYYAESFVWGYTEEDMLVCDKCNLWVHAGCANLTEEEYNLTSNGEHPIYSKEFLCRKCCRRRCKMIIEALQKEDTMMVFALPVSENMAPNYLDVIKKPMDLETMMTRAENEEYPNYAWVRESFELMVLNALTFNRYFTPCWNEAKRFYEECTSKVFKKLGKAAPPGNNDEIIHRKLAEGEEARKMEEERVKEDASTEKKDLVAGSEVTSSVTLPPLRDSPPDVASCLPFTEVKLQPVDAFYCAWMDYCFTCGSSGATDTMMFCVDCGEAFHSFCANVPIHSMEMSSVAGWRCPNCKICEISGETPKDELRMLFCDMCDRGFSLDLLDPPLKKAPSGIWVCGQCVDCKVCSNTSEPYGVSLKYWSCNPEKCYRCGGCKGVVKVDKSMKCVVCTKILRTDDDDYVSCTECESKVHVCCDFRADEHIRDQSLGSRTQKAQKAKKSKYRCPSCFTKLAGESMPQGSSSSSTVSKATRTYNSKTNQSFRKHLHDQAWFAISRGTFQSNCSHSSLELHQNLMEEFDWNTREIWKDEYVTVVQEGIRVYSKAKALFGDARVITMHMLRGKYDLPSWMCQRACRFMTLAKKNRWDSLGYREEGIRSCAVTAKLSASFLEASCRVMEISAKQYVKCYGRVTSLLKGPHECGHFELPVDVIRSKKHKGIMQEHEVLLSLGQHLGLEAIQYSETSDRTQRPSTDQLVTDQAHPSDDGVLESDEVQESEHYRIASPLYGWDHLADTTYSDNVWKDPRECCLCHLCGDDDAGFEDDTDDDGPNTSGSDPTDLQIARLGRLLPMSDGMWVHACCALWSSEVWEAATGGQIFAVEKARSRGAQLKCFGCGRPGATVGCNKANCSFNYHYPCSKACRVVFTSNRQMFCSNHSSGIPNALRKESFQLMRTLIVAPEKQKLVVEKDTAELDYANNLYSRVGCFILHSLGTIEQAYDGFHTENYIFPVDYLATRIYWSSLHPRTRTVYILRIQKSSDNKPIFSITPCDDASSIIRSQSIGQAYSMLMDRVRKVNDKYFSAGDMYSKLPTIRRTRNKIFGLNGPQFFGIGLNIIRKMLENSPGVEAVVASITDSSPKYRFCYVQPTAESIVDLQRKRAAVAAERALENSSGCARTEGRVAVARSGGSGRITRALVRSAAEEEVVISGTDAKRNDPGKVAQKLSQAKYQRYKSQPMEQRLVARRSHIHGWGLFSKVDIDKDDMIVEYMGEIIRQCIADKRENEYEMSGEGSCYMFRLDQQRIVDATVVGCMARFMNHCCQPNAYAKVITVDTEVGTDKKIAVFALRDITAGEEITYDYKFPVEDGSLRCSCGAPNCIGRMN